MSIQIKKVMQESSRRGFGGGARRSYGLRLSERSGWLNTKTGKRTADMVVFTIDGDWLQDHGFGDPEDGIYVRIAEIENDGAAELAFLACEPEDKSNGDKVYKFRDEVIDKKPTGYLQLFVNKALFGEMGVEIDRLPMEEKLDHNQIFDISDELEFPAFSITIEDGPEDESDDDGEYADAE